MEKKLASILTFGILLLAFAGGAHASAVVDTQAGGSYHFTWGAGGAIDHVFAISGSSIVPGNWNNGWSVDNTNLGNDWSITGSKDDSKIATITVWQHPDIDPANRVEFTLRFNGNPVAWTSTNSDGPFLGTIENLMVGAGTYPITLEAVDNDEGGAFVQLSGIACAWNLEGSDSDVDGLDLHAAIGSLTSSNLASFAEEFGRTTCP